MWSRRRSRSIAAMLFGAGGSLATWFMPIGHAVADDVPPFRLCADPDNLPFSSAAEATPGFYIELGREIARALGRPFEPVWVPTYYAKRQIRKKLLAGQCDGFVGVPDDPSFMGPRLVFSKPVIRLGYALVAPPAMAVNIPDDLHGRRVAVQFSTPPQDLLAVESDVQMVTVLSPEEAVRDLAEGKADAAFIWGASAGWLNSAVMHDAYRVVPFEGENMQWDAAIAFPRDSTDLRDQVDRALGGLGPTIDALASKYRFPRATPVAGSVAPAARDGDASAAGATGGDAGASVPPPAAGAAAAPGVQEETVAAGRKLFNQTCSHCHGPDAVQGDQRRNLRLLRARYGDDMTERFKYTVTHGRVSKGMPNWSGIVSNDEFDKILAFLSSVQETGSE